MFAKERGTGGTNVGKGMGKRITKRREREKYLQFQQIQLRFLRNNFIDMWRQERIRLDDFRSNGSLDG